jgi:hypothetical protein
LKNVAAGVVIATLPWLASGFTAAADLPPILAYLLFPGRGLFVLLGGVVAGWALLRARFSWSGFLSRLEPVVARRSFALLGLAVVSGIAFARVPQEEKEADAFGGDEPKYLRIAFSLLRDTDADIGSGRTNTPDLAMRVLQLRNLAFSTRDSLVDLFEPSRIPEGHVWNAGNWTVRGREGGLYHLQPPGLPALVAVALGIGELVLPERDPGIFVFVFLALVWIMAARELWLLSLDLNPDPLAAVVLLGLVFLSAPVFIGGYQLFPESLCFLLFPWLLRRLGTSARPLEKGAAILSGTVCGYLLWVHPKLTIVAAFFVGLALLRRNVAPHARLLFAIAFAVTAFLSLLYCYQISGLFRPEGLYIRQAEEYVGSPNPFSWRFLSGVVKALLGGRDGLLIFAPVLSLGLVLGLFGLRDAFRGSRADLELFGLFVVVWLTSAVHDGASLGSPARLMAPVAFVPAIFLSRGLRGSPSAKLCASAALLFIFGCIVTLTMTSDWRRNVNPYRTMFANPATNFESNLPGNSFSEDAYAVDLSKGALLLGALMMIGAIVSGRSEGRGGDWAPTRFGLGVLAIVTVLSYGLRWLGSP